MDKAVTEYEKTEAAIETIFAEPKPAEPLKPEEKIKGEQKKEEKEQTNLGFNEDKQGVSDRIEAEFLEMTDEKIK